MAAPRAACAPGADQTTAGREQTQGPVLQTTTTTQQREQHTRTWTAAMFLRDFGGGADIKAGDGDGGAQQASLQSDFAEWIAKAYPRAQVFNQGADFRAEASPSTQQQDEQQLQQTPTTALFFQQHVTRVSTKTAATYASASLFHGETPSLSALDALTNSLLQRTSTGGGGSAQDQVQLLMKQQQPQQQQQQQRNPHAPRQTVGLSELLAAPTPPPPPPHAASMPPPPPNPPAAMDGKLRHSHERKKSPFQAWCPQQATAAAAPHDDVEQQPTVRAAPSALPIPMALPPAFVDAPAPATEHAAMGAAMTSVGADFAAQAVHPNPAVANAAATSSASARAPALLPVPSSTPANATAQHEMPNLEWYYNDPRVVAMMQLAAQAHTSGGEQHQPFDVGPPALPPTLAKPTAPPNPPAPYIPGWSKGDLAFETRSKDSIDPSLKSSVGACTCKKSKCLKLYCVCFAAGVLCGPGCKCGNCLNNIANAYAVVAAQQRTKRKNRAAFRSKITSMPPNLNKRKLEVDEVSMQREPGGGASGGSPETTTYQQSGSGAPAAAGAPAPPTLVHTIGCRCKNSKCIRRYCECFRSGVLCGPACKCLSCSNGTLEARAEGLKKIEEEIDRLQREKVLKSLGRT